MAKDARQKCIFFASWTGTAIEATAAATKVGTNITAVAVDAGDFQDKVGSASGTYVFTYDGTSTTWKLNGSAVTLSQYGIEITGTDQISGNRNSLPFHAILEETERTIFFNDQDIIITVSVKIRKTCNGTFGIHAAKLSITVIRIIEIGPYSKLVGHIVINEDTVIG